MRVTNKKKTIFGFIENCISRMVGKLGFEARDMRVLLATLDIRK